MFLRWQKCLCEKNKKGVCVCVCMHSLAVKWYVCVLGDACVYVLVCIHVYVLVCRCVMEALGSHCPQICSYGHLFSLRTPCSRAKGPTVPSLQLLFVQGRVTRTSLNCPVQVKKQRTGKLTSVIRGNAISR